MERAIEMVRPRPLRVGQHDAGFSSMPGKVEDLDLLGRPWRTPPGTRMRISQQSYYIRRCWTQGGYYRVVVTVCPWSLLLVHPVFRRGGQGVVESEKNRFTIIVKGKKNRTGARPRSLYSARSCDEVRGKTKRERAHGETARKSIVPDDAVHYFTPPLANGESLITVTAQNAKAG